MRTTRRRRTAFLLATATATAAVAVTAVLATAPLPDLAPFASAANPGAAATPGTGPDRPMTPADPGAQPLVVSGGLSTSVRIPILVYHFIRVNPLAGDRVGAALSVTPADFTAQMAWLAAHGYRTITPAQLVQVLRERRQPVGRIVMLTFDDGFDDFATTAVPILRHFGFTAVDYVVSGFIGLPGYMTEAQIRQVDAEGMTIGAHTVHHVPLAQLPITTAAREVTQSKAALQAILGHPVLDFAYPYGSVSPAVEVIVRAAGFRSAVTTLGGIGQPDTDAYGLRRMHVNGGESISAFIISLAGGPSATPKPSASPCSRRRRTC